MNLAQKLSELRQLIALTATMESTDGAHIFARVRELALSMIEACPAPSFLDLVGELLTATPAHSTKP
jgi:hypothetical protein